MLQSGGSHLADKLIALLDLIDRPAAVCAADGRLLGGNQLLLELLASKGRRGIDAISSFLDKRSCERVLATELSQQSRSEFEAICRDGVERTVCVEVLADVSGSPVYLLVLRERELRRSEPRAGAALRHDLAGPLTAILGTAELMLMRGEELPREMRNNIGQILENCGRMSEILARSRQHDRQVNSS